VDKSGGFSALLQLLVTIAEIKTQETPNDIP
jgi:hypothetical protein